MPSLRRKKLDEDPGNVPDDVISIFLQEETFLRQFARKVAFKTKLQGEDVKGVEQEALLRVLLALPSYNPDRAPFRTFAKTIVHHAVCNFARQQRLFAQYFVISLDDLIEREEWSLLKEEVFAPTAFEEEELERDERIWDILSHLKPKEKQFLLVWLECGTDKATGEVLGISPTAAKLRRRRLFAKLRRLATKK